MDLRGIAVAIFSVLSLVFVLWQIISSESGDLMQMIQIGFGSRDARLNVMEKRVHDQGQEIQRLKCFVYELPDCEPKPDR